MPRPPVPELPAGFSVRRTMHAQYEADRKAGNGTDLWMDRMLARKGEDPSGPWLFTRGRAVFMKEHNPSRLGFGGKAAYWESIDNRPAYTITLTVDGENLTLRENTTARTQTPSYWRGEFTHEATGLVAPIPDGEALTRAVAVPTGGTVTTKVQLGFVTEEMAHSRPEYDSLRTASAPAAFRHHVQTYNRWWAKNLPSLDVPDGNIEKTHGAPASGDRGRHLQRRLQGQPDRCHLGPGGSGPVRPAGDLRGEGNRGRHHLPRHSHDQRDRSAVTASS